MERLRELLSEFWPYTRGDRLRLLGGGLLSLVLVGAELGTVIIFEAIVGRVLERHHLSSFWVLAGAWLAIAAAGALVLTSRPPAWTRPVRSACSR